MENKSAYLIWALVLLALLGCVWLIVEPIIWWTPKSEMRLYIRIFLLMFAVSTFATLRLYNSIVQNTRFSIKLREAIFKFISTVPGLERSMKHLGNTIASAKSSVDSLKKESADNTNEIKKLTEKIKRL